MKGGAGCPMRIVTVVPWLGKLDGLKSADLSAEAKLRGTRINRFFPPELSGDL
jgi:hypothetical protein